MSCFRVDASNPRPRSQLSSHLVPLIKETFQFLRSLASHDFRNPSPHIPSLIHDFLDLHDISRFVEQDPSGVKASQVNKGKGNSDSLDLGRDSEEPAEAEIDELLMHMSLADDGQVGRAPVRS